MKIVKTILFWIGAIVALLGCMFFAQGIGWFPYPGDSFMIGSEEWLFRGAGIAAVGFVIIIIARRLN